MAEIVPRLGVVDLERELKFYTALGFDVDERTEAGALVVYEGVTLALRQYEAWRVTDRSLLDWERSPAQLGTGAQMYLIVRDVDDLAARIPVGVPRPWPVQEKAWGYRELTLRTPAGYLLTFAQRAR